MDVILTHRLSNILYMLFLAWYKDIQLNYIQNFDNFEDEGKEAVSSLHFYFYVNSCGKFKMTQTIHSLIGRRNYVN